MSRRASGRAAHARGAGERMRRRTRGVAGTRQAGSLTKRPTTSGSPSFSAIFVYMSSMVRKRSSTSSMCSRTTAAALGPASSIRAMSRGGLLPSRAASAAARSGTVERPPAAPAARAAPAPPPRRLPKALFRAAGAARARARPRPSRPAPPPRHHTHTRARARKRMPQKGGGGRGRRRGRPAACGPPRVARRRPRARARRRVVPRGASECFSMAPDTPKKQISDDPIRRGRTSEQI